MNDRNDGAPTTKGLDFALLARAREEIARSKAAQEQEVNASATAEPRMGAMAQRVVAALCGSGTPVVESGHSAFAKGRVVFRYDFAQSDLPAMVVTGGQDAAGSAAAEAEARQAVADAVAVVYRRRQAEEEARAQRERERERERERAQARLAKVESSEDDRIFLDAPCQVEQVREVREECSTDGARREYFETDPARRMVTAQGTEGDGGAETLLDDLVEGEKDAEVARLRAEVERLRELQQADDAQRAQDRQQDSRASSEMDPAMRRYFAVCHAHILFHCHCTHIAHVDVFDKQRNTANEQLQARLHHDSQEPQGLQQQQEEGSEEYAECYPSTYELQSFWDFRAADSGNAPHGPQRTQRAKTRDEKIARDLNKLEQWKRNGRTLGEVPGVEARKRARVLPPEGD